MKLVSIMIGLSFVLVSLHGCASAPSHGSDCPGGKTMEWYWDGIHMIDEGCVVNAKDTGKICNANSQCTTNYCDVPLDVTKSEGCEKVGDWTYSCPGISGYCAATNKIGSASLITREGLVTLVSR